MKQIKYRTFEDCENYYYRKERKVIVTIQPTQLVNNILCAEGLLVYRGSNRLKNKIGRKETIAVNLDSIDCVQIKRRKCKTYLELLYSYDIVSTSSGVYFLFNSRKYPIYIGTSENIRYRTYDHLSMRGNLIFSIGWISFDKGRYQLEEELIQFFKPLLNNTIGKK